MKPTIRQEQWLLLRPVPEQLHWRAEGVEPAEAVTPKKPKPAPRQRQRQRKRPRHHPPHGLPTSETRCLQVAVRSRCWWLQLPATFMFEGGGPNEGAPLEIPDLDASGSIPVEGLGQLAPAERALADEARTGGAPAAAVNGLVRLPTSSSMPSWPDCRRWPTIRLRRRPRRHGRRNEAHRDVGQRGVRQCVAARCGCAKPQAFRRRACGHRASVPARSIRSSDLGPSIGQLDRPGPVARRRPRRACQVARHLPRPCLRPTPPRPQPRPRRLPNSARRRRPLRPRPNGHDCRADSGSASYRRRHQHQQQRASRVSLARSRSSVRSSAAGEAWQSR